MNYNLILTAIMLMLSNCDEGADDNFITLCRPSSSTLRIDYLDSRKAIAKVESTLKGDTLVIKVYVSSNEGKKSWDVNISDDIKIVALEKKHIKLTDIFHCKPVKSGEEAVETLKKMGN